MNDHRTIYKYPVRVGARTMVPATNAKPLHFGRDPLGVLCIWLEVDSLPSSTAEFPVSVVGTGWNLDESLHEDMTHFMSAACGEFVWHCYTEPSHA